LRTFVTVLRMSRRAGKPLQITEEREVRKSDPYLGGRIYPPTPESPLSNFGNPLTHLSGRNAKVDVRLER
jgi:hypothetical protein